MYSRALRSLASVAALFVAGVGVGLFVRHRWTSAPKSPGTQQPTAATPDLSGEIRSCEAALAADPNSPELRVAFVRALLADGRLVEAQRQLAQVAVNSPVALTLKGMLLTRQGQLAEAERLLTKAREAWPESAAPGLALARLFADSGRGAKAVAVASENAEAHPDDYTAQLAPAQLLLERDVYYLRDTAKYLERALELAPRRAPAYGLLARLKMAQADEALPLAEQALALDEANADGLLALGWLLAQRPHDPKAVVRAERALRSVAELHPQDPTPLRYLGTLLERVGRFQEAAEVLERACRLAPTDSQAWYALAAVEASLGRRENAAHYRQTARHLADQQARLDYLELTLRDAPDSPEAHADLAEFYLARGDVRAAEGLALEALALDQHHPRALHILEQTRER